MQYTMSTVGYSDSLASYLLLM